MGRETLDAEHYWLRESVTLPYEGQSRTIEITVPVRIGASPDEVEALLTEVGDSMARLSRHVDAHVARALAPSEPPAALVATQESLPDVVATPTAPASAPTRARASGPLASPSSPAPVAPSPAAPASSTAPAPSTPTPAKPSATPAPSAPATPTVTALPAASARPASPIPAQAGAASGGGELSRPQFIAAAAALGLNPKQAMDRLGVRTLEGLNLREALETLRRQQVLDGDPASATPTQGANPEHNATPANASITGRKASSGVSPASVARAAAPTVPPAETYVFDEEEDLAPLDALGTLGAADAMDEEGDDSFMPIDASLPLDADPDLPGGFELDLDGAEDPLDMEASTAPSFDDEDEDLAPLRPLPTSLQRAHVAEARKSAPDPDPPARTSTSATMSSAMSAEARSRVVARIGKLRAAQGGGAATPYQLNAYKNLVIGALGEPTATQLVRGVWNLSPAQLGSEQVAELVDWAKKDEDFEGEAQRVLSALRAERERAVRERANTARSTTPTENTGNAPRGPSAGGRPATRRGGDA